MRKIDEIIIHCSATRRGQKVTRQLIDRWHRDRGFTMIGYHYLIFEDGHIEDGRPLQMVGAHCVGHNAHSVGICYIGGLGDDMRPADTRTAEQRETLRRLVGELCARFPGAKVYGHRELTTPVGSKACPCFDVKQEFRIKND